MFSGSVAELGENAGEITWNNALDESKKTPLLDSVGCIKAREYFEDFGAWSKEELAAMTDTEINALTLQYISGDIRELESYDISEVSGNIFKGDDNQFYFYMGH